MAADIDAARLNTYMKMFQVSFEEDQILRPWLKPAMRVSAPWGTTRPWRYCRAWSAPFTIISGRNLPR